MLHSITNLTTLESTNINSLYLITENPLMLNTTGFVDYTYNIF